LFKTNKYFHINKNDTSYHKVLSLLCAHTIQATQIFKLRSITEQMASLVRDSPPRIRAEMKQNLVLGEMALGAVSLPRRQGDQIGRLFTLGGFFIIQKVAHISCYFFRS
jgi:hypothetical protein